MYKTAEESEDGIAFLLSLVSNDVIYLDTGVRTKYKGIEGNSTYVGDIAVDGVFNGIFR